MLDTVHMLLPPTPDSGVGHVGHAGYSGLGYSGHAGLGYSGLAGLGYGYAGRYGKREAEAEADAYTIGQVHAGPPSITSTLPDMATMLELSPDTDLMLLPPTQDML